MSFIPDSKRLYDLFVSKLNDNTYGVNFDGNFVFRFWQQQLNVAEFEVITQNPDTLNWEAVEVVPVVNTTFIEIPYVEKNRRSDYELEFYIAIKIPAIVNEVNKRVIEFNADTNEPYQALLEALNNLKANSVQTIEGYKYAFKVREPAKVNVFRYNGQHYQIFALNVNVTALIAGFFGNETDIFLAKFGSDNITNTNANLATNFRLDFVEASIVVGKQLRTYTPLTATNREQFNEVNSRTWTAQITVNDIGNTVSGYLKAELHGLATTTADTIYNVRIRNGSFDYTYKVLITSINTVLRMNGVVQITLTLERVE